MRQTSLKKKFASLMCCMLSLTCTLGSIPASASTDPVSYTHLDVYKRQDLRVVPKSLK